MKKVIQVHPRFGIHPNIVLKTNPSNRAALVLGIREDDDEVSLVQKLGVSRTPSIREIGLNV